MKNKILVAAFGALVLSGCAGGDNYSTRTPEPSTSYGAYDEPYPVLNAYGNWMDVGAYGRVWQPAVMSDWRPYSNGQWVWTDRGWMWDSDEPYGWVVYHYGYWTQIGALGWVWVPGNEWSPARVEWYSGNDYVAWCPMPPPHASRPEAYQSGYENYWTVVPAPEFTRLNVGAYRTIPPPSRTPPPASRGRAAERPPDIITIQGATHQLIPPVKTVEDQVRVGRRSVARVRVVQDDAPLPRPVYAVPASPDASQPAPSAPPVLPGGARIAPRTGAPAVIAPPPVQERTPFPVRVAPAPAPVTTLPAPSPSRSTPVPAPVRGTPAPAPVRVTPVPAPVRGTPAPAPVRVTPVPVAPVERPAVVPPRPPERKELPKEEKKDVKQDPKPKPIR